MIQKFYDKMHNRGAMSDVVIYCEWSISRLQQNLPAIREIGGWTTKQMEDRIKVHSGKLALQSFNNIASHIRRRGDEHL
jgi:hypothetical protein